MSKIPFNVSAKTAQLIGRQNVSNLEGALVELIKNTYDADATECIVYFERSSNSLWIIDNGTGMDKSVIADHWMTIGNSSKTTVFKTISGRVQTGEKGIGRFALDRLASNCTMHTLNKKTGFTWTVDWSDFSSNKLITEVFADIENDTQSLIHFCKKIKNKYLKTFLDKKFSKTGTCFKLTGLSDEWSDETIKKVKVALSRLLPPSDKEAYKIYFFQEESSLKEAKVSSAFLESYDYKITFSIQKKDLCEIKIHRNEFSFGKDFVKIMNEAGFTKEDRGYFQNKPIIFYKKISELLPGITEVDFVNIVGAIYFYKLSSQEKNETKFFYKEYNQRKESWTELSGIKLYRDNFIVRPYGFYNSDGYDWLNLSTRKATSPAGPAHPNGSWRVQANQVGGQIYISRLNKNLPDKSSREGILETKDFYRFKELILKIISLLEEDRQYVIRKLDKRYTKINKEEALLSKIQKALKDGKTKKKSKKKSKEDYSEEPSADDYKKVVEILGKKLEHAEEEMGLLRTLATTGIVVNTYIHEIKSLTTQINIGIKEVFELLTEDNDVESAIEELKKLRQTRNSFNSWFKVTLDSVKKDKRKMQKYRIGELVKGCISSWEMVHKNTVKYTVKIKNNVEDYCFPFDFDSIINNLITNSTYAFKNAATDNPQIEVSIGKENEYYFIEYKDNGPGLAAAFKSNPDQILKQGTTDKRNANGEEIGTGMGMWIVNNIVIDYGGYIDLSKNKQSEKGFSISLYFKAREIGGR